MAVTPRGVYQLAPGPAVNDHGEVRHRLLFAAVLFFGQPVWASFDADVHREAAFRKRAMFGLGGWAAANIAVGLPLAVTVTGPTARAFWQMNVYWNVVNLAIAGYGLWSAYRLTDTVKDARGLADEQRTLENFLWLNVGLDVAYAVAGWALLERGKRLTGTDDGAKWTGFGQSLLLQGAFLLAFDVTLLALTHRSDTVQVAVVPQAEGLATTLRWTF